jgi:hypothetical protein
MSVIACCLLGANPAAADTAHPAATTTDDAYNAAEKITQGDLGRPFVLPSASRARMHECSLEWQAMKMSGAASDKIWRVFATACLTSPAAKAVDPQKAR